MTKTLEVTGKKNGHVNELDKAAEVIRHPCRLIITGRATMGKTTLAVDLICANILKDVRRCFAVCPTFWQQDAFQPLRAIPNCFTKRTVFLRASDQVFDYIFAVCSRDKVSPCP